MSKDINRYKSQTLFKPTHHHRLNYRDIMSSSSLSFLTAQLLSTGLYPAFCHISTQQGRNVPEESFHLSITDQHKVYDGEKTLQTLLLSNV